MTGPRWRILVGEAVAQLGELGDGSVHTVVTSPPYWGLRDYGTAEWVGGDVECDHVVAGQVQDTKAPGAIVAGVRPGADVSSCRKCGASRVDEQRGLERTPDEYLAGMVEVFDEVFRVLRDDGTLWLNIGDSYATGAGKVGPDPPPGAYGRQDHVAPAAQGLTQPNRLPIPGLKPKDLVGIPWRLALALQAAGWTLRADIIWAKPNPMPESVRDRPTKAHEYVFLLTKGRRYFYDADAIAEPSVTGDLRRPYGPGVVDHRGNGHDRGGGGVRRQYARALELFADAGLTEEHLDAIQTTGLLDEGKSPAARRRGRAPGQDLVELEGLAAEAKDALGGYYRELVGLTKNARSVWTITTKPFREAHFATFPLELPDRCILAGTSEHGVCAACGAPWIREVERTVYADGPGREHIAGGDESIGQGWEGTPRARVARETKGWTPGCECGDPREPEPAVVLDPFSGSAATGVAALRRGRSYVGIELNPEYAEMGRRRILDDAPLLNTPREVRT